VILFFASNGRDIDCDKFVSYIAQFFLGCLFGFGLVVSGILRMSNVQGLLNFADGSWNPQILVVFGTVVFFNTIFFHFIRKRDSPVYGSSFSEPSHGRVDAKLIIGAMIFGAGYGLAGFCTIAGVINCFILTKGFYWVLAYILSQVLYEEYQRRHNKDGDMHESLL